MKAVVITKYDDCPQYLIDVNGNTVQAATLYEDARRVHAYHVCNWCRAADYDAAFSRLASRLSLTAGHDDRLMMLARLRDLVAKVRKNSMYLAN